MSDALQELGAQIEAKRPDCVLSWSVAFGELTVEIAPSSLTAFTEFLKTDPNCRFSTMVDITGVDYPARPTRFDVVYHYLSMYLNHRIRVRCAVHEDETLTSITEIYPTTN